MLPSQQTFKHWIISGQLQTVFLIALVIFSVDGKAGEKYEIKSGTMGSSYCTPFDSPRCQAYNQQESQLLYERRQYERRIEDLERRDREREMERHWEDERDSRRRRE